jgi:hypothetical protein
MIRLNSFSHLFDGINVKQCALLFLSTPHSGSTEADWNRYLVDVAELTFGIRSKAVDALRSFNPQSTHSCEDFGNMSIQPPYACFYETRATKVMGLNRHVSYELLCLPQPCSCPHPIFVMEIADHNPDCHTCICGSKWTSSISHS